MSGLPYESYFSLAVVGTLGIAASEAVFPAIMKYLLDDMDFKPFSHGYAPGHVCQLLPLPIDNSQPIN